MKKTPNDMKKWNELNEWNKMNEIGVPEWEVLHV